MRYAIDLDIALPRRRAIELFDNPDHWRQWQPGLVAFEHSSGIPGAVGARSKLRYVVAGQRIDVVETVVANDLPDTFVVSYEASGICNLIDFRFIEIEPSTTRWSFCSQFEYSGSMKFLTPIMPRLLRFQAHRFMRSFKRFAEARGDDMMPGYEPAHVYS